MLSALSHYRRSKSSKPVQAVIAWINAWRKPDDLRGLKEFDAYWNGASAAAQKAGYLLEEFRIGKDISPARLDKILNARGIRSILLPPHPYDPDWEDFSWQNYFVVRFGRSLHYPRTHLVTADQTQNTVTAFEKMLEYGYQRIGFATRQVHMTVRGHLFEAGYLIAQQILPPKQRLPVFSSVGKNPAETAGLLSTWLAKHRPDAILTDTPDFLLILGKLGLRVPEDIAVASTTVRDTAIDSGIDQNPEEIGRVGFLLNNSLVNDGARGIPRIFRQILVEGTWVDGKTLPDRRK